MAEVTGARLWALPEHPAPPVPAVLGGGPVAKTRSRGSKQGGDKPEVADPERGRGGAGAGRRREGRAGPRPAVAARPGTGTALAAAPSVSMAAWREPAGAIRRPEELLLKIAAPHRAH